MFLLGSFVDSWKGALNGVKCNQIPFIGEQFAATMTVKEILHQLIWQIFHYVQGFSTIPGGCLEFLNPQQ